MTDLLEKFVPVQGKKHEKHNSVCFMPFKSIIIIIIIIIITRVVVMAMMMMVVVVA